MAGGAAWWRRVVTRAKALRAVARDTQRALQDVTDILHTDPQISATIQEVCSQASRSTAIVILGTSGAARARLVHCLLGRRLLPDQPPRGMRWVRVQFGSCTGLQLHLTVGAGFQLLEEAPRSIGDGDTLRGEDLIRQDPTDLSTTLEVELNNPLLKDGLKIIIPPDLDQDSNLSSTQIKELHSQLYAKRELVLKNYNCVYLYAIDRIGTNIFSESISCSKMAATRSEEDFWNNFGLYSMRESECASETADKQSRDGKREERRNEPSVFTAENCLDLQEIKHINPHSQVLFALFSDCTEIDGDSNTGFERDRERQSSATESTESRWEKPEADQGMEGRRSLQEAQDERRRYERQSAFMSELLDQWEMMTSPPPAHYVKSQSLVLSYPDITRTPDHRASRPPPQRHTATAPVARGCAREMNDRTVRGKGSLVNTTVRFAADCFHTYLLDGCTRLGETHVTLVQRLILASFDLARELQVVPRKIQYVSETEHRLYESITSKFSGSGLAALEPLMKEVLDDMAREVREMDWTVDDSPCHQDSRFHVSNSIFYSTRSSPDNISIPIHPKTLSRIHNNQSFNPTASSIDDSTSLMTYNTSLNQNASLEHNTGFLNHKSLNQTTSSMNQTTSSMNQTTSSMNQTTSDTQTSLDMSQLPSDGEEAVDYSSSYDIDEYEVIDYNDESLSFGEMRRTQTSSTHCPIGEIRVESGSEQGSLFAGRWLSGAQSGVSAGFSGVQSGASGVRAGFSGTQGSTASVCTNSYRVSVKHATLDVQKTVLSKLSRKISLKLVNFVDCLKDSYFGTLQRCLSSLEWSCRQELGGSIPGVPGTPSPASQAMAQLLTLARVVDLQPAASYSRARSLLDLVRRLLARLRVGGESSCCCPLSAAWRRRAAEDAVEAMRPRTLASLIARQIVQRLQQAHARYQAALAALQAALETRLTHTEDVKLTIRKKYAPLFARLCLESTSMCDLLMYGVPELGREIGRGQYGVVYAVRGSWGPSSSEGSLSGPERGLSGPRPPLAVKSVLPHDQRHYNELAMEFFYTRSIPSHPRIVPLLGSVVQSGAVASGPRVLLVSARRQRDLHSALRAGLHWTARLRIALDIVEGIRYLHSLGLVHRDIKMKNVLLDCDDRAALSDLGFCACEALLTGSVVGTPVHMAPELLQGDYHMEVDVYAFGILFWYVCAGSVRLPGAFESCQSKEQLWASVRKGLRPERLPQFSDECWSIMSSCWSKDPADRPLLGDIQLRLQRELQVAIDTPGDKGDTCTAGEDATEAYGASGV